MHPESLYRTPESDVGGIPSRGFRIGAVGAGLVTLWLWLILSFGVFLNLPVEAIQWAGFPFLGTNALACIGGGFVAATGGRPLYALHAASVGGVSALPPLLLLLIAGFSRSRSPLQVAFVFAVFASVPMFLALVGAAIARWRDATR